MDQDGRKRAFTRLRMTAAVVTLLLGWLAPMLPLAASELDVCGMAMLRGRRALLLRQAQTFCQGHVPARWAAVISEKEVTASCPLRCAQPASGFHHLQFPKAPIVKYAGEVDVAQSIYARTRASRATLWPMTMQPPALRHSPSSEQFSLITVIANQQLVSVARKRQAQVRPKSNPGHDASVCASCSA